MTLPNAGAHIWWIKNGIQNHEEEEEKGSWKIYAFFKLWILVFYPLLLLLPWHINDVLLATLDYGQSKDTKEQIDACKVSKHFTYQWHVSIRPAAMQFSFFARIRLFLINFPLKSEPHWSTRGCYARVHHEEEEATGRWILAWKSKNFTNCSEQLAAWASRA